MEGDGPGGAFRVARLAAGEAPFDRRHVPGRELFELGDLPGDIDPGSRGSGGRGNPSRAGPEGL